MVVDKGGDNIYIYDTYGIKTISLAREGQDVWKLYLDNKKYQDAYEICRKNNSQSLRYVNLFFIHIMMDFRLLDFTLINYSLMANMT